MKRLALSLLLLWLATAGSGFGQGPTAAITGQIRDSSGAVILNAHITATNVDTGVSHGTNSDQAGNYALPILPIGRYSLRVEAAGFNSTERTGLILVVDQKAELSFTLQVGNVSNVITVEAAGPQLETEQHSLGTVLDEQKLAELPLNSRTFYALAFLIPGVVPPANNSYLGFRGGFNVAGAPEYANNFTLDGFDNNNEQLGAPGFRPSIDAIQEFKVLTGLYGAEYGRDAGGQVVVTGKSGTNAYHGLLYEYVRNQMFDAKNYFAGPTQPAYKRNQFGGTLGGRIIRDKTFFFMNYEGLRFHQQLSALATVPTAAMLNGDFSSLLPATQLKNPFTGASIPGNLISSLPQWNSPAATIGKALAGYYPAPTRATAAGARPSNNYTFNPLRPESANQFGVRGDHNFSQRDSMFVEGNYYNNSSSEPYNTLCGTRTIPGFGCESGLTFVLAGISEIHVFSPTLVNSFRASFNRYEQTRFQQDGSIDFIGKYNIPNVFFGALSNNLGLPQVAVTGFATLGGPSNNPQDLINNEFQVTNQLIWTKSSHSLKFGIDIRRNQENVLSILTGRGSFSFTGSSGTPTTGYPFADLLLGLPTTTSNNPYAPKIYVRTSAFNAYIQDDWKMFTRLTLNLGLRWELNTPFTAVRDQQATFVPSQARVVQAGTGGLGSNLIPYHYSLFQPRLGFAYRVGDKTVLRGGYGVYVNAPASFAGIGNLFYNQPMRNPQTFNSSTANPLLLSNPFPATAAGGASAPYGINQNFHNAYIQQYGFGVQRELTPNTLLDVSYFGSKGTHLPNEININQPPAQSVITSTAGVNALRPFPAFGNIVWYESNGISNFNSLQAKLEKRFSYGFTALVSFTYGKSLDNTPGFNGSNASNAFPQNSYDRRAEYGPSDFDVRHRLAISGVYELPFGHGKKWLDSGVLATLAGGWQLSEIFSQISGRPFTLYYSSNVSNTLNVHDRPNIVGDLNAGPKQPGNWFNAAAVVTPALGTFGNEGRNAVVGPGYVDLDTTLARIFKIRERLKLEFRAEFFNVLNHPNFDLPGATINGAGYNSVTTAQDPRQLQLALRLSF